MLLLSHSASSQDAQHADDTSEKQAGADQSPKTSEDSLTIEAPAQSRPDEAIDIRIVGAPPGEPVEFSATIRDSDSVEWRSSATFVADAEGVVNLAGQRPTSGSWDGSEPMGWLWSMRADEDQPVTALMAAEPTTVELQASAGGHTATRSITRAVNDGITATDVDRHGIVGTVYEPADSGPHPGVLVLHPSGGSSVAFTAALLAEHGFTAFALDYIGDHDALPDRIRRVPLDYFDEGAQWFRSHPGVADGPLGIVGHSRGAEVGLRLAATREWAGPVVSYVGSPVIWNTPMGEPAWLDADGDPLPFVDGQGKPTLCEGQLDEADAEAVREATTHVEAIDGPVCFISGGEDPIWPASRLAELGIDRLDGANFDHAYEHRRYDDAGHFITPPYLPKSADLFGGPTAAMARADADAWPAVLDCLDRGLRS